MTPIEFTTLPNGQVIAELPECVGEDAFYSVYSLVEERLAPESIRTTIDSLCVAGAFIKDGVSVRMSSEGTRECFTFMYDPRRMTAEDAEKARTWLNELAQAI
jgi:hypothetical protein